MTQKEIEEIIASLSPKARARLKSMISPKPKQEKREPIDAIINGNLFRNLRGEDDVITHYLAFIMPQLTIISPSVLKGHVVSLYEMLSELEIDPKRRKAIRHKGLSLVAIDSRKKLIAKLTNLAIR